MWRFTGRQGILIGIMAVALPGGWPAAAAEETPASEVRQFRGFQGAVHSVAFAPDGRHIVAGGTDRAGGFVQVWQVSSGKRVRRLRARAFNVHQVGFIRGRANGVCCQ